MAAVVASAVGLAVLVPPSAAHAGTSCSWLGCSETYNYSQWGALAVRDWTCGSGTTGTASTGCVSLQYTEWLSPGERTPSGQDWDAFRVDAGWCYVVELHAPGKKWHVWYDRSKSSTPVYVKVENWGVAYIRNQKYGSCP